MSEVVDVSIVVVNYNTFDLTCACVDSIISLTQEVKYEIIIVDNASTERDADAFLFRYPQVRLIRNEVNVGFGIANNQAMAIAKGTYFLLINSDCYLLNNAIDLTFRFAQARPEISVLGATVVGKEGLQVTHYKRVRINWWSPVRAALLLNPGVARAMRWIKTEQHTGIGGLFGTYVWLQRGVYEAVGGFDPDFFMYCEDTEWFRKRIAPKYMIDICKEARVFHLEGGSGTNAIVNPQKVLSYYLYWYKMGKAYFWLYAVISFLNLPFLILFAPFMSRLERLRNVAYTRTLLRLMPRLLFDIPQYSNRFGGRGAPLRVG